ncbi:MAG: GAF domain-containing sensor histidine kinase [Croceibacterium sp.]
MSISLRVNTYSPAPLPPGESERLRAIDRYRLAGADRDASLDRIAQLAAQVLDVPIALVSIVQADNQCFPGASGLDVPGTPRDVAFCAHAILSSDVMVVPDAVADPRFAENPLVTGEPHIRFYAGAPLVAAGGHRLGTLCAIDHRPREFGAEQRDLLTRMADLAVELIERRLERFALEESRLEAQKQEELLKLTVENVGEGLALVDERLRLILWNNAFLDFFGYESSQVSVGGNAAALIALTASRGELGPGNARDLLQGLLDSIYGTEQGRVEVRRKDGRVLDVCRQSLPGGRFIMTARDVTAERTAARLKDELVSTVSHELRTPLTAIHGAVKMLAAGAGGDLPPKAARLATLAQQNAERLVTLVNNLLDLDKLQSGQLPLEPRRREIGEVTEEAVRQNQLVADQAGVTLVIHRPAAPVYAEVDPMRFGQVITNLVSNACKFAPRDSVVTVTVAEQDTRAIVSVADQGPGIAPEFRDRLFQRFAQQDGSLQKGHYGSGLGLAISREIVEAHGGTIELDSTTSQGATFRISLPLAAAPADKL